MSNIENITNAYSEFQKKVEEFADPVKKELLGILKNFMNEYDFVEEISWRQYTPYFNDGDSCEFSVKELEFKITGWNDNDDDDYYELPYDNFSEHLKFYKSYSTNTDNINQMQEFLDKHGADFIDNVFYKEAENLATLHRNIPDDLMLTVFGDHVKVTLNRTWTKFDIEEYVHD